MNGYIIIFAIVAVAMIARARSKVAQTCKTCAVCPAATTCPECKKTVCPPEKSQMELAIAANEKQVADAMNGKSDTVLLSGLSFGNKAPVSMYESLRNVSLSACMTQASVNSSAASWMPDYTPVGTGYSNGRCAIIDQQPDAKDLQPVWAQGSDRGSAQPWTQGTQVAIIPYSRMDVLAAAVAAAPK